MTVERLQETGKKKPLGLLDNLPGLVILVGNYLFVLFKIPKPKREEEREREELVLCDIES